jgi:hypothetical protein
LRGIRGFGGVTLRHDDAHRHVRLGLAGGHDVERPDAERDEVARQRLRRRELVAVHAVAEIGVAIGQRVRDCNVAVRHVERQRPRDFRIGLVEAREHATRADRLELREHVRGLVGDFLERAERDERIDLAGILERELDRSGLHRRVGADLEELFAARRRGDRDRRAVLRRLRRSDRQVIAVQPDRARRIGELAVDLDRAVERRLVGIDREPRGVARRQERARQAELRNLVARRRSWRRRRRDCNRCRRLRWRSRRRARS